METIKSEHWYFTPSGDQRGYIESRSLKELWFHTGTACNLSCPFCLEGSKPGDNRLQLIKFDDAKPYIDEALSLGVEQFSFTGGEPFVAKDLIKILDYAANFKPCMVLTNGTAPVLQRLHQLQSLVDKPYPVKFRISIDYPIEKQHDAGRGQGSFTEALSCISKLIAMGFSVSVARQMTENENSEQVQNQYQDLFKEYDIPLDTPIIAFPDFHPPNESVQTPHITEHCMTEYHTSESRAAFMCHFSKMLIKSNNQLRIYACTLVDDDPDYDQGRDLKDSLDRKVMLKHHRCFSCFKYGASCSEG
ncbi:MAG: radical SAM protein [Kangiellaceae bacterium]|nr:radical SAM protein [Kangiellaceae bacterium]|tara:strand:+ start:2172 stop:3083 length:912 start_codon:yes stop_codon:yes gene_type:complete